MDPLLCVWLLNASVRSKPSSEEFWEVDANVTTPGGSALPLQVSHQTKPFRPENREQTMAAVALLEKASYGFWSVKINRPAANWRTVYTSTLQPAASTRRLWREENHDDGQRLYETGYITICVLTRQT